MSKENYKELLKLPKWIAKRNKIKKRDKNKCTKCKSKFKLEVHHTYYLRGKMPWEVSDDCLITLCHNCHSKVHLSVNISSFIRDIAPNTKKIKKSVKKAKNAKQRPIESWNYLVITLFDNTSIITHQSNAFKYLEYISIKGFDNILLAEHSLRVAGKSKVKKHKNK